MRVTPAGRINLRHTLSRRVRGVTSAMFLALAVAAALTLTGCGHQSGLAGAPATNPAEPASLKIEPAPGARDVDPVAPVAVSAQTGTLTDVAMVNDAGKPVQGVLTPDAKFWHSVVPLGYGRTYTLTVTSRGPGGKTATQPVSFSTLTPPIRPSDRCAVRGRPGVGHLAQRHLAAAACTIGGRSPHRGGQGMTSVPR